MALVDFVKQEEEQEAEVESSAKRPAAHEALGGVDIIIDGANASHNLPP